MKLKILCLLFSFFVVFHLLASFTAPRLIPAATFPYKDILATYNLPQFIKSFANFDGIHYLLITRNGYAPYEQAFFPLYPFLIYLFDPLLPHNPLVLGLTISSLSTLGGLIVFTKYLKLIKLQFSNSNFQSNHKFQIPNRKQGFENLNIENSLKIENWVILFLLAFPTSFFFVSVYTEGLFFFLFISSLYFLEKRNYPASSLFAFLASLTRFIGVLLIIPFGIHIIEKIAGGARRRVPDSVERSEPWREGTSRRNLLFFLSPLLGSAIYGIYLWKTTGDPLFFLTAQSAFGAQRSTKLILIPQVYFRYIKIFLTTKPNFQYFISLFEFFVFTLVFLVLIIGILKIVKFIGNWKLRIENFPLLGLHLFSLANLILPTLTGTFSSIPRYALLSLSFFVTLATIKNTSIKTALLVLSGFFHILIFGLFIQGYFVS